jgi:GNAT superfamily N-acetyltransferase
MTDRFPPASEDLIRRCHRNAIASYRSFADATEGGRYIERPGLVLIDTGAADSMGNAAFVTRPPEDPPGLIGDVRSFFSDGGRPWVIIAFPEAAEAIRPAATAGGLLDEGSFPGMVLDPLPGTVPDPPAGYRVETVRTLSELRLFERTGSAAYGFDYSEPDARWLERPDLTLFLGSVGPEAVALGALIVSEDIAGLAYIGTLATHRRRGFAEALVWRAVQEGRRKGCDLAYLWATPIGRLVYDRMGFQRILDYRLWTEPGAPLPPSIHPR